MCGRQFEMLILWVFRETCAVLSFAYMREWSELTRGGGPGNFQKQGSTNNYPPSTLVSFCMTLPNYWTKKLKDPPSEQSDVCLCIRVLYFCPDDGVLKAKVIAAGGLGGTVSRPFLSHRVQGRTLELRKSCILCYLK